MNEEMIKLLVRAEVAKATARQAKTVFFVSLSSFLTTLVVVFHVLIGAG